MHCQATRELDSLHFHFPSSSPHRDFGALSPPLHLDCFLDCLDNMAPHDHQEEGRPTAALPQSKTGSIKLPLIEAFQSPEAIVQALTTRDTQLLTAALLQVEKRATALCNKAAPRAEQDPLLDYLSKFPTTDGLFSAWDTAHKVSSPAAQQIADDR